MTTLAASTAHSGHVRPRTAPELSDIALFVMAVAGVAIARWALRRRFAKERQAPKD